MKKTLYLYVLITFCTLFFSAPLSADAEKTAVHERLDKQ